MKTYLVGGAVRDLLLGGVASDRDFVVVGATAQDMLGLGFTQVGADFPVFLHPETHDEYALARTERKSGVGYHGFLVGTENVTLEEDLARRDLTINAMAMDDAGAVIDPYSGQADLQQKVLRHVGPAFAEDPVRVLRLLRFHARYGDAWTIAPETQELMQAMVARGELTHLTGERVWKELSRALMEPHPHLFAKGMLALGLTSLHAFAFYTGVASCDFSGLQAAVVAGDDLAVRMCLVFGNKGVDSSRFVPGDIRAAMLAYRAAGAIGDTLPATAEVFQHFLRDFGAYREGFHVEQAARALTFAGNPVGQQILTAKRVACAVDIKAIAASMPPGPAVSTAIASARVAAIAKQFSTSI